VPQADTIIREEDEVVVVTSTENQESLRAALTSASGDGSGAPGGKP